MQRNSYVTIDDLEALSMGSVFLATGGGGDPYLPMLLAKQALLEYGPVYLVAPDELNSEDYVVALGAVGAPTVSLELLPSIDEAGDTLRAFEKHTSKKVNAIASFEIGGGNSLLPLVAAAGAGIPMIDGDGMGRALPEAQMMTYAIAGAKPTPAVARDYAGNTAAFSTSDTTTYERHIRSFSMAAGGMITAAEHPMSGAFVKTAIIPHTVSFAINLGKVLIKHRGHVQQMMPHLKACFEKSVYGQCKLLFEGKITDKSVAIVGGYDVGELTVAGFNGEPPVTVNIKNEYLIAKQSDKVLASVPDLIVLVDIETSEPINAERIKYGQRVAIIAVECPAFYKSKRALAAVSPRAFGFDFDYVALSEKQTF